MDGYEFKKVPYRTVNLYLENGIPRLAFSTFYPNPQTVRIEYDHPPSSPDRVWTEAEILAELEELQ